ncbi:L,D-transpeptidase family protein [Vibrio owensii]|uniref:L,D-transpeptidase family protein n=1 Tax=Vibrio harveyi group TaxID=717610 RepID=UPI003CC569FE
MIKSILILMLATMLCHQALASTKADFVLVQKSSRMLFVLKGNSIIEQFRISLGKNPIGHKIKRGDNRTPEGIYTIDFRNPQSKFHYSLHINYPNKADKAKAQQRGLNPGGDIYIHGLPNGKNFPQLYQGVDWTNGCIGLNNLQIMKLAELVPDGTPIQIIK